MGHLERGTGFVDRVFRPRLRPLSSRSATRLIRASTTTAGRVRGRRGRKEAGCWWRARAPRPRIADRSRRTPPLRAQPRVPPRIHRLGREIALATGEVGGAKRREQFIEPVGVIANAVEAEQHTFDEHRADAPRGGSRPAACTRSRSTRRRQSCRWSKAPPLPSTGSGRRWSACRRRPPSRRRPSSSSSNRGRRSGARRRRGSVRGCRRGS